MAQKVTGYIKLQIPAAKATASPPVGPALGQHGVNIAQFIREFNDRTKDQAGFKIPVVITVYADRSFSFVTKTPPTPTLILKAIGQEKGSGVPNKNKVGTITKAQVREIAERKMPDLTAATIEAASHLGFAHVHVLFQPHRYSRAPLFTEVLKDDFGRAFDAADAVTFMDVYPAGEAPVPGVSGKTFLNVVLDHAGHPEAAYVPRRIEVVPYLAGKLGEGDLLITMGAGDVTAIGPQLVDALSQADGAAARRQA